MKLQQLIYGKFSIVLFLATCFLALPLVGYAQEKIAFVSSRDGNSEIYVMNADGSNQTRLTNNSAGDSNPSLNGDGSKIVFQSWRDGNAEIYVMNADGSNQTRLTNNPALDDFPWLNFDGEPSFNADGSKIVFTSQRDGDAEIYVMNSDGSNQINLTNNPGDDFGSGFDYEPSFSADGSKIAFVSGRDGGNSEIYVMNADGSNPIRLTNNSAIDSDPSLNWNGSKIVFRSNRDANHEIYVMNADGSNQTNLTNSEVDDFFPSFYPDGSRIAFTSDRDDNYEIYVMNSDGSNQTNATNHPGLDFSPSWNGQALPYQFSLFNFSGLLLQANQLNHVSAGSIVSVNFTLGGFQGENVYSSPPASQRVNCLTKAPIGAIQPINRTLPDPQFIPMFGFYTTTWLTEAQWAGTCRQLTLSLNDGTQQKLDFYFQ